MKNLKIMMNGPLFFQLLVYAVFIALNLLQFDEVIESYDCNFLLHSKPNTNSYNRFKDLFEKNPFSHCRR